MKKLDATLSVDQRIALAKQKAREDTMKEYGTMVGKRSRTYYEKRVSAYREAADILMSIVA